MNWHPQPSLGAACTTREHLSPKSTLGLSGQGTTQLHTGSRLCVKEGEREGRGTRQCPRAGHNQRDKTGVEAPCCHPCSDAALAICSALLREASLDLILSYRRNFEHLSWAERTAPQGSLKLHSNSPHTPPHQQLQWCWEQLLPAGHSLC